MVWYLAPTEHCLSLLASKHSFMCWFMIPSRDVVIAPWVLCSTPIHLCLCYAVVTKHVQLSVLWYLTPPEYCVLVVTSKHSFMCWFVTPLRDVVAAPWVLCSTLIHLSVCYTVGTRACTTIVTMLRPMRMAMHWKSTCWESRGGCYLAVSWDILVPCMTVHKKHFFGDSTKDWAARGSKGWW